MANSSLFNTIIVSNDPRGRMFDVYVSGTPLPGTVMQIKSTPRVNGLLTVEAYNRDADGNNPKGPLIILLEDHLQGLGISDAYADGAVGHAYVPLPGDELLLVIGDVSGTGDAHSYGEILMVDDGTGELIATTGTPEKEPFMLLEDIAAPTADVHGHVIYAG